MFIHTHVRAPKRFAKFGRQKRTFCGEKEEKAVSQTQERQAIVIPIIHVTNKTSIVTVPICMLHYLQSR